jgi:hypothetical protein
MEKIIKQSKASFLFSKRNSLVRECLITFLNEKDILTLAKTCRDLLKASKKHFESWPKKVEKISKNFKIDLSLDTNKANIDSNIFNHILNKRAFQLSNEKSNLFQFLLNGKFRYFALANKENWAWNNDTNYWRKIKLANSTLGIESYELLNVCWLDLNLHFQNVKPGKYKVFLRQGLRKNNYIKNKLSLKILIKANFSSNNDSNIEHEIYECKFMNEKIQNEILKTNLKQKETNEYEYENWEDKHIHERITNKNEYNELMDCYITSIEIPDLNISGNGKEELNSEKDFDYTVIIRFFQNSGCWKSGWLIDSGILEKID